MSTELRTLKPETSLWPHRLAVLLCCATFPLVWVGGLVTSYKAGMAFPDWPTSGGYFLFFYPWLDWLRGPWDMYVEHGHRLLASLIGLLTIAFCASLWMTNQPKWLRRLGWIALAGIVFQGVLGGIRVLLNQETFAMIHGCVGPAFFALTASLAVVTSRRWQTAAKSVDVGSSMSLPAMIVATPVLAYLQLVLGAQLRHYAPDQSPAVFQVFVLFHIVVAVALTLQVFAAAFSVWRKAATVVPLVASATILPVLILLQLALGAATWISKYGWPAFLSNTEAAANFTVQGDGWRQAQIATAHVATGSLILAVSTVLAVYALRMIKVQPISGSEIELSTAEPVCASVPRVPERPTLMEAMA